MKPIGVKASTENNVMAMKMSKIRIINGQLFRHQWLLYQRNGCNQRICISYQPYQWRINVSMWRIAGGWPQYQPQAKLTQLVWPVAEAA